MLTRLQVSGFRNLVDADVRFGPFTCVVGPNGAGKSNLFDAIRFLSALADGTLGEAAGAVCRGQGGAAEVRGLFHRSGDRVAARMTFVADMVVPWRAVDDLGQETMASSTLLRYLPGAWPPRTARCADARPPCRGQGGIDSPAAT